MDDLISRQAILKNIEKIRQGVQMMDDTHRASIIMNGMYLCEKAVRDQPSIQPEIIYCRNCKKHNVNAGYKKDCCPLFDYRGISYGHEHDYQYCVYGVKKDERLD